MKRGLCQCGCGSPTTIAARNDSTREYITGEPVPYLKGHNHRKSPAPATGYEVDANGCWIWKLKRDRAGYGRITRGGRTQAAHRYFYELRHGPTPEGLEFDHLCRNPSCVNPDHLEPVTPTENKRRSRATKLSQAEVAFVRRSPLGNSQLAELLGVDPSNISHIRAGRSWVDA